jgi:hypothetical protein
MSSDLEDLEFEEGKCVAIESITGDHYSDDSQRSWFMQITHTRPYCSDAPNKNVWLSVVGKKQIIELAQSLREEAEAILALFDYDDEWIDNAKE